MPSRKDRFPLLEATSKRPAGDRPVNAFHFAWVERIEELGAQREAEFPGRADYKPVKTLGALKVHPSRDREGVGHAHIFHRLYGSVTGMT